MSVAELDFQIDEHDLVSGALQLVHSLREHWKLEDVHVEVFKNGITNKLLGLYEKEDKEKRDMIMVRVYGAGTEAMIDRQLEIENIQRLHTAGCGSKLYATFKNGLAYEYIKGKILDVSSCRNEEVFPHVAQQLSRFHQVPLRPDETKPILWDKMRLFLSLSPSHFSQEEQQERFQRKILSKSDLKAEITYLEDYLTRLGNPIVFCHNDLLLGNIIYNHSQSTVSFIDFEYAGPNFMAFDIANHFNEFAGVETVDYNLYPSDEFQFRWLRCYLESYRSSKTLPSQDVMDEVKLLHKHVNLFSLASHFFWGLWSLVQASQSTIDFDFLGLYTDAEVAYLLPSILKEMPDLFFLTFKDSLVI